MPGKDPAVTQWAIQVLTSEYLVEGSMDSRDGENSTFLHAEAGSVPFAARELTRATLQPTGALAVAAGASAKFSLPYDTAVVAVIPRDAAGSAYALKRNSGSSHPIPANVYAGPYLLRGTILSPDKELSILAGYQSFAMQAVTIDSLAPGARLRDFQAPYVIVRTHKLHGIVTAG